MAVWVYKDEESELIDASLLDSALVGGWSVTKGDSSGGDELELLKAKAKEMGIKGYHKMHLETLRVKVNGDKL